MVPSNEISANHLTGGEEPICNLTTAAEDPRESFLNTAALAGTKAMTSMTGVGMLGDMFWYAFAGRRWHRAKGTFLVQLPVHPYGPRHIR
jgi:hypothetical protein